VTLTLDPNPNQARRDLAAMEANGYAEHFGKDALPGEVTSFKTRTLTLTPCEPEPDPNPDPNPDLNPKPQPSP